MILLILGWCIGYAWCCIWRLGRPQKISLAALIAGYMLGKRNDRDHTQ